MTKEIELKVFVGAEAELDTALSFLRSVPLVHEYVERDIYYTSKHKDFIVPEECLRIRSRDGASELTWKAPTTQAMLEMKQYWKRELNVDIGAQATVMREMLESLDFVEYVVVEKHRREFRYDAETKLLLDAIRGVGLFVEIETMSDNPDYGTKKNAGILERLGMTTTMRISRPYRDIVKDGRLT